MNMQNACARILDEVDGALGCIVVDMGANLPVAAKGRRGKALNASTVNLVSEVSANMFCGKLINQFEKALDRPRKPSSKFVQEVQMTTENTNQFMAAIPGWEQGLLVLVTDKTVSLGLGWMAVHRGIERLSQALESAPRQAPHGGEAQEAQPKQDALAPAKAPRKRPRTNMLAARSRRRHRRYRRLQLLR